MKKIKPLFKPFTPEELLQRQKTRYEESLNNPERMSYWLPFVENKSELKIPKTQIIQLSFDQFISLFDERNAKDSISEIQSLINQSINFEGPYFIKTGNFSDKFCFNHCYAENKSQLGENFYNIFYHSLMLGVPYTSEIVIREFIPNIENVETIYEGMPLHTEYRVFYDFDKDEIIDVVNYWHPDLMESHLKENELNTYLRNKERIIDTFNWNKKFVKDRVKHQVSQCGLKGKWSIDVMQNNNEFYLIDMARLERSALTEFIKKETN